MNKARRLLFLGIGALLFMGILSFSFYHYAQYKKGPQVTHINLQKFTSTNEPSLLLEGEVSNAKSVKINGRDIILEHKKGFKEIVVFSKGNNIIEILLEDPFGKTKFYTYNVYYKNKANFELKTLEEVRSKKENELSENIIN